MTKLPPESPPFGTNESGRKVFEFPSTGYQKNLQLFAAISLFLLINIAIVIVPLSIIFTSDKPIGDFRF